MNKEKLSENELRILLFDYVARSKQMNGTMPSDPIAIKTILISDVIDDVAKEYGIQVLKVLPEPQILKDLDKYIDFRRCIFGFGEEIIPIIDNTIQNNQLVQNMKRYYKEQKKSLNSALEELYQKYGYFKDETIELQCEDEAWLEQTMDFMQQHPPHTFGGYEVVEKIDNENICKDCICSPSNIPETDLQEYMLKNGARVIMRRKKSKPHIYMHFSARGRSEDMVTHVISNLKSYMTGLRNY